MPTPPPITEFAANVRQSVKQQLATPAALIVPAPIRRTLTDLAELLVLLAMRVDMLSHQPKE